MPDLVKAFQVSKYQLYLDGDPQPYVAEVTFPELVAATEEFNNTSTGGLITISDPFRYMADGQGEVKFEADSAGALAKIANASSVVNMNMAMIQNTLQPQLGQFLPNAVNYKVQAQFGGVDFGAITPGAKREISAKFNMFALKITVTGITVIDYDFVNGQFSIKNTDLLSAVTNILG